MRSFCLLVPALMLAGCAVEPDGTAPPRTNAAPPAARPDADGFVPIDVVPQNQEASSNDGKPSALAEADVEWAEGTRAVTLRMQGETRGYLYTSRPYRDFTLRCDVRWSGAASLDESERPNANTGVLVFITGEHKVWPRCLEVQGKWSELAHIKSNAKDVDVVVHDDDAARQTARKPIDEWNSIEIVAKDGSLTTFLNSAKIAESEPTELREGPIGFQAERFAVEFRNVRIREN